MFGGIFNLITLFFDILALAMVVFAAILLVVEYVKSLNWKKNYTLTHKQYLLLRAGFVHRIILALDLFIASDLVKLAYATTTEVLVQILLIVVIRTILSHFLAKEVEGK